MKNIIILLMVAIGVTVTVYAIDVEKVVAEDKSGAEKTTASPMARRTSTLPASQSATITAASCDSTDILIEVEKGQYFFIGLNTGIVGKNDWDVGINPIWKARVAPADQSTKCELRFNIQPVSGENGEKMLKWSVVPRLSDSEGAMREGDALEWEIKRSTDETAEPVLLEKIDVSKEVNVQGLKAYRIPYEKVKDEIHYVLIVIGKKKELFPKAVSIPKSYIIFSWDRFGSWL